MAVTRDKDASEKYGSVPTQGQLLLPMLDAIAAAGGAMRPGELYDELAKTFDLDNAERNATVTYGAHEYNLWERKVRWARQTAVAKGLLKREKRGLWELTDHANVALRNARRGVIVTAFETSQGIMFWSCAEDVVAAVERDSLQLIFTSPPYPLLRPKAYGNLPAREWLDWMLRLCEGWHDLLTPTGSLMLNLGTV